MKMFHVHAYFNEDEVMARLKGQLYPNMHFEKQYILFRDLRSSAMLRLVHL
jgi:hypothetical protein